MSITKFQCPLLNAFSELAQMAMNKLLRLPMTYLCEAEFSLLVQVKTKNKSRLEVEDNMLLAITKLKPRLKGSHIANNQEHMTHTAHV